MRFILCVCTLQFTAANPFEIFGFAANKDIDRSYSSDNRRPQTNKCTARNVHQEQTRACNHHSFAYGPKEKRERETNTWHALPSHRRHVCVL